MVVDNTSVQLRPAVSSELAEVRSTLAEATSWLRAQQINQWHVPYPLERIEVEIVRGEVWLGVSREGIVGTLTLLPSDDLWHDLPAQARYLHRLAVRRAHRGAGTRMIDEACAQLAANGIQRMRLDCERANIRLRSYYERLQFEHRGDVVKQSSSEITYEASRYERKIPDR